MHSSSVYSSTQGNRQETPVHVLFERSHKKGIFSKPTATKTAPGILSSNTFSSAISSRRICFTSSLFTEATQAHAALIFPPPLLTKQILQILPPLPSQLFFLQQPLCHTLHLQKRQNFGTYECPATPPPHDKPTCIEAVTQRLFQDSFLHIVRL